MSLFHSNPERKTLHPEFHFANLGSFSPLTQRFWFKSLLACYIIVYVCYKYLS